MLKKPKVKFRQGLIAAVWSHLSGVWKILLCCLRSPAALRSFTLPSPEVVAKEASTLALISAICSLPRFGSLGAVLFLVFWYFGKEQIQVDFISGTALNGAAIFFGFLTLLYWHPITLLIYPGVSLFLLSQLHSEEMLPTPVLVYEVAKILLVLFYGYLLFFIL